MNLATITLTRILWDFDFLRELAPGTELNNNCACVRLVNEQSETSVQNKYGGAFVGSFDSVFSLWKGSCAVNNFRGKLSCFEFGFCIKCEDEVHADDSECPSEWLVN